MVGFNTGFGSGDDRLKASWIVDLKRLLDLELLAMFTCANDHSDLAGERQIMEGTLDAKYVLYPRRSPFSAVTTTHAPGRQADTWACANSFVYAIKGRNTKGGGKTPSSKNQAEVVRVAERPAERPAAQVQEVPATPIATTDGYDIEELD